MALPLLAHYVSGSAGCTLDRNHVFQCFGSVDAVSSAGAVYRSLSETPGLAIHFWFSPMTLAAEAVVIDVFRLFCASSVVGVRFCFRPHMWLNPFDGQNVSAAGESVESIERVTL